ncbi:hypothetical protein [Pediococcus parvulus]|uniref:hypothetical protein n=1 Tax=Pediococcus parvulus TaxID=54062 RepID=UPI00345E746F
MKQKKLWVSLLGLVIVAGVVVGLTNLKAQPARAKTSQAVTLYNQWKKAYVGGKSQKYVKNNNGSGATYVTSEGQGYGMLATVLAAKRVQIRTPHIIKCTLIIVPIEFPVKMLL